MILDLKFLILAAEEQETLGGSCNPTSRRYRLPELQRILLKNSLDSICSEVLQSRDSLQIAYRSKCPNLNVANCSPGGPFVET